MRSASAFIALLDLVLCCVTGASGGEPATILDDFTDVSRWEVLTSDGVSLGCSAEKSPAAPHASTIRLDYDFKSSGFAGVRLKLPLDLPENFEIAFSIRGELPRNNLEFKLVDITGECVWWVNRRTFEFPRDWTRLASRRRHFQFAWGPSNEPLRRASAIEIMVASAEGGSGTVWLDDLTFRPLPETKPYTGTPTAQASSTAADSDAQFAIDGSTDTEWQSEPDQTKAMLTIDFGQLREFGGMVVHGDPNMRHQSYELQFSDDGESWTTARKSAWSTPEQFLSLPDSEARVVRFSIDASPSNDRGAAIREIEFLPLEVSRDANTFAAEMARRAPRGYYPRATSSESTFWTIVGVPVDEHEALVSEDGAVEVDKQAFIIEPFVSVDNQLLSWANAKTSQSLAKGFAPVPTVTREYEGLKLEVTASADGDAGRSVLLLLYTLTNTGDARKEGKLQLALRPFQVNPPYQWLNTPGGASRIGHIELQKSQRLLVVDDRLVALGSQPDEFSAYTFDEGNVVSLMNDEATPGKSSVDDPQHAASGAVSYDFALDPGEEKSWALCVPFGSDPQLAREQAAPVATSADAVGDIRARQQAAVEFWDQATHTFDLLTPPAAVEIVNSIRSQLAYILINQDGQAIHPGSRSYERAWIRDGTLTATALLRFGLSDKAREFVAWYAPYQFPSGKVPCVVDRRGGDPVPENDSHGQLIMAVMNVYRFTGDKAFLEEKWPRVEQAVAYIEQLRAERMTPEYADPSTTATKQEPGKPPVSSHAFYGLIPESISHEGYSAKAMHSYWDDFFVLKGLKDAAEMARNLDKTESADRYQKLADEFAATLYASIDAAMAAHEIDYIPGCVELGDFDATSTTIALWPCGETSRLPQPALANTFDKYWDHFVRRRDDPSFDWIDYTPYELRVIGSFVLLGQPERAQAALEFFMHDRRPLGWNQWPEVVHRDPRVPKFIGDLPHTWCGSDFVNSVRLMFLYEREEDNAVVLLAGIPAAWLSTEPVGFRELPTYGGRLTCTLARSPEDADKLLAYIAGTCPVPKGKLRLSIPSLKAKAASVNGKPATIDDNGRVVVDELPADVEVTILRETDR